MSAGCGAPLLGGALCHGPWLAGAASFAVTPGALWLLGWVLERRRPRPRQEFLAVTLGDPLLAVALALGVARLHGTLPGGAAGPPFGLLFALGCLGFGLLQWRTELREGYFTREQALAPTKVWHQLVVYPVLGYWLWTAVLGAFLAHGGGFADLTETVLMVLGVLVWVATNVYDRANPKLGHPPYDWRRLRPRRGPWAAASTTLRAYLRVHPEHRQPEPQAARSAQQTVKVP
ncbi:hypothetical protein [Kitasatospora sp. LaBMicrA B282]|uniref:hypothetical protein n=1 Tax=Kitasatospora sp. LaBMicrA B282 TaxID=3420949 RepID=UPI003D0F48FA